MAESKRMREDSSGEEVGDAKRHKYGNEIFLFARDSVDELGFPVMSVDVEVDFLLTEYMGSEREEEMERVLRLLFEASDDELGIPNREESVEEDSGDDSRVSGEGNAFPLYDCFWDFDDSGDHFLRSESLR